MAELASTDAPVAQPNLALVLERITDGFFALDADWRITYMNLEARRLLRVEHQDPIGRIWLDAFPKARGRLFEREYARAMREQAVVQFVEYSATSNCWFEVKAYPSSDGLSVYFRDVSARIEAQREVERNVRRQRAIIDFGRSALGGGLSYEQLIADALDLVRDVLETPVVEIYDCRRGQFTVLASSGWAEGSAFDRATPALDHIREVVRTGDPFVSADIRTDPRAKTIAALARQGVRGCICALIGTPSQPRGAIVAGSSQPRTFAVGDVRFVESIAQAIGEAASANESTNRMRQVIESMRDAFVALDRDLRITFVNARMVRFWNRTAADMIGTSIADIVDPLGVIGDRALAFFREALEREETRTFESPYLDRWYEFRLYPFSDGIAAYVRDITKRREEQRRITQLNAELELRVQERTVQLELANKELESFSYSVSHDLRAPLRAIDGFSQALVEDYDEQLDERARNYLDRVRKAAQRMADLIDALLQLARVARAAMSFRTVDLSAIAHAFAQELRERDPDRHVEFRIEPDVTASGEPNLLRAVLENLMGNAWKFTRNLETACIEFGKTREGGEYFVRDNGAGFDMAYGNKLFGAFQRLHAIEDYEGTGIGLATVARIVHRHGGTIRAEGALGQGACFSFILPTHPDGVA